MSQINPIHDPNTISLINNNNNFKLGLTFRSSTVTCPFSPEFQTITLYISHTSNRYVTVGADASLNLPSYLP
jgi:hypothetical protein